YFCYVLNALGYVFGGPLPNQVILSRYFDAGRGRAMGIAYLGIGIGAALVLWMAPRLIQALACRGALRPIGVLMPGIPFPAPHPPGYGCGAPVRNQVIPSRLFGAGRGRAMGIAYLGIGIGGALVLWMAPRLIQALGWRGALRLIGVLMVVIAFPAAFLVREPP